MSASFGQHELAQALASLESDRDAILWTKRRALAASLGEALPKADLHDIAVRLVHLLADDTKWEVRKEIASLLPLLPDDDFMPLAAKLTQDANGYVRKSAERGLDLRRKGAREIGNRRKGLDQVVTQFDLLGSTQGRVASDKARALAVRLYELAVGATVHDLRGVLTSARSHLARLQSGAANSSLDGTTLRDGLGKVADRLAYLEKFIDAMGTYAQAVPPERATARLADIVRDAHSVAVDAVPSAHLEAARVEALVTVDDGIMVIVAPHQIVAAIANVLKNAYEAVLLVEADDRTGQVRLTAGRVGNGEVEIVVRDNGMGMNADDLRDVRALVPGRTTKKGYGTGFGLPIAQRYIAAHGGAISIESTDGAGTTVTIVLPTESQQGSDE
jgi:signal transduction histidine kinase